MSTNSEIIKMYAIFARETLRQMKFEGKLAAQAGHAYLHAWWDAEDRFVFAEEPNDAIDAYADDVCMPYRRGNDARKITLVVDTVDELRELYDTFRPHMGATLVEDCGYTVFDQPTITAVGLGPIQSSWTKGTRLGDLETLKNEIHVQEPAHYFDFDDGLEPIYNDNYGDRSVKQSYRGEGRNFID